MSVVGLDLSLTATGIARKDGSTRTLSFPRLSGMERLDAVQSHVTGIFAGGVDEEGDSLNPAALVVIEGYSMGTARQASHAHALGELGGVVRHALWEMGLPVADVAPASLKKFATGKGNANKDAMLIAAVKAGADVANNNEADAWWLRQMGLYRLGLADVVCTAYRDEAVARVDWPEMAGAA